LRNFAIRYRATGRDMAAGMFRCDLRTIAATEDPPEAGRR
jgi:hypothetical protein